MFKDPLFLTKLSGAVLVAAWVVVAALFASWILYRPADIEKPAYPLLMAEESGETAGAEATEPAPEAQPETAPESQPEAAGGGIAALLADADSEAGAKIARKCSACHSFDKGGKNKVGPNLWDVVGRDIAGAEGYKYSGALSGIGGAWGYGELNAFLTAPKAFANGTKMSFAGIKKESERADLIAYLRSLSDNPQPLP
jgi:cytochrome c